MQRQVLPGLADTHCHLEFEAFDADRSEVLARARQAGLRQILNPGVDIPSSRAAIALAENHSDVYAAAGIHPNDILHAEQGYSEGNEPGWDERALDIIDQLTTHPKVVAVGEIGLDYYRDWTPHNLQQEVFQAQLELAARRNLPVIIHSREAMSDTLQILSAWQKKLEADGSPLATRPGVLHSFSGSKEDARRALDIHFRIGFTGPVTYRNAAVLQQLAAELPPDCLLVETDAPFLTPAPHRGQRNEPAYVKLMAEKIAELRGQTFSEVAEITSKNAGELFNW